MPKGPLGAPRPFSQYRIIVDPHERDAELVKIGPFGGPRPFAKNNPPVTESEVAECMVSDAGTSFGAGVLTDGKTTNISELPPEQKQRAYELAEEYCRGLHESLAMEDLEEDAVIPFLSEVRDTLERATGRKDNIDVPMRNVPVEVVNQMKEEEG